MNELKIQQEMVNEIRSIMNTARQNVAKRVNSELLVAYWNIGRVIVEHEQDSNERAEYGQKTLKLLSRTLTTEFGKGFSVSNLQFMRRFYQTYQIQQTVSVKLSWSHYCELLSISDRDKRSFYEKECERSGWSVRELKRQISTSLFERLLLSDNPPIGIILCTDKSSVAAEYALGGLSNSIFASTYTYVIPDKERLIEQVEAVLNECSE